MAERVVPAGHDPVTEPGTAAAAARPAMLLRCAAACVLVGFAVLAAWWAGLLLVVGEVVVRGWAVAGGLGLTAAVLLAAVRGRARYRRSLGAWVAVLGAASLLTAAHGFVSDERYVFLSPASPSGCRAVVAETSFLLIGGGTVHTVRGLVGWQTGSYISDDGYRPFSRGAYDLRWGAGGGAVSVRESHDPVWPDVASLGC